MLEGSGVERAALFEIEHHGCAPCVARQGAGSGAACEAAKICASTCIIGGAKADNVGLRACVDRQCAAPSELELLYPRFARAAEGAAVGAPTHAE